MQEKENNQIFQIDILKKKPKGVEGHKNGHATNTFILFSFLEICIYKPRNLLILFLYMYIHIEPT